METAGQALRRWRKLRGLSLRDLADAIKYSHTYLWEIEHNKKPPLPEIMKACDDLLEAKGELIALTGEDDVKRRDLGGLALAAMLKPSEALAGLTDQLWTVYAASVNKGGLLPLVHAQLTLVKAAGHRANLLQLAGEIHFDANRYADAASCYVHAAHASQEAPNYDLWACALIRHAFLHVYERRFADAVPLLEQAARLAAKGDHQLTTAQWVQVVKAQAFAGLGRFGDCQRALDLAQHVDGKTHNGGWLRFHEPRIAEESGFCYVELGKPDLAETALLAALKLPLSLRRRGTVFVDLAMVGVLRKDREQIKHYASAALAVARETGSGVVMRKMNHVQTHILETL